MKAVPPARHMCSSGRSSQLELKADGWQLAAMAASAVAAAMAPAETLGQHAGAAARPSPYVTLPAKRDPAR